MDDRILPIGTEIVCTEPHPDGNYCKGDKYKINAHRYRNVPGGVEYVGVRVRDDKRQRKDFNFIPESKNFIWRYFSLTS